MKQNRLALVLISLCAICISSVHSAPAIILSDPSHESITQLERVPSIRYLLQAEENDLNDLSRRNLPSEISSWSIWESYKKAAIENQKSATAVPDGTPEGTKSSQGEVSAYSFQVDIDCVTVHKVVQLGKELGSGTYGSVYEVTMNSWNQTKNGWERWAAAAKTSSIDPGQTIVGSILAQRIQSRYVAKVWDYFYVKKSREAFVVMPMADRGTLEHHIKIKRKAFKELFRKVLLGVQAIHAEGIMHRDIKPGNVLLFGKSPKIADFDTLTTEDTSTQLGIGTAGFLAPEILINHSYTKKIDIFALGIMYIDVMMNGISETELYSLWKALVSPKDTSKKWLSPVMVEEVLNERLKFKVFNEDDRRLLSNVLCEPDKRFNIDQYIKGYDALQSPLTLSTPSYP